jgi:hypothetical protein
VYVGTFYFCACVFLSRGRSTWRCRLLNFFVYLLSNPPSSRRGILLNYLEDGRRKFCRNVGTFIPDQTSAYPRRLECLPLALWQPCISQRKNNILLNSCTNGQYYSSCDFSCAWVVSVVMTGYYIYKVFSAQCGSWALSPVIHSGPLEVDYSDAFTSTDNTDWRLLVLLWGNLTCFSRFVACFWTLCHWNRISFFY